MYEKSPAEVNAYLSNPAKYLAAIQQASDAAARGQLELVYEILVSDRCATFQDCISWARKKFEVALPLFIPVDMQYKANLSSLVHWQSL